MLMMSPQILSTSTIPQDLFKYAESKGFGDLHIKFDPETGLRAIIAIHSTKLGPTLGGCRCLEYNSMEMALYDALRLARAMSYKAALANLNYGGGKSVLMKPHKIIDRKAYFAKFGEFIETLNGRYIAAEDIGTTTFDMDTIAEKTRHVVGLTKVKGDPSPYTALGIKHGIEAAVEYKLGKHSLKGLDIAVQGVGKVGYYLAKELHQSGANLIVADINSSAVEHCVKEFSAQHCPVDKIHQVRCDVFAPCALGAILNERTIPEIKASIVAGGANNQLSHQDDGNLLQQRNILYAPDYVINAGGLMYAASQYDQTPIEVIKEKVNNIHQSLIDIFELSQRENLATNHIADLMAEERLK